MTRPDYGIPAHMFAAPLIDLDEDPTTPDDARMQREMDVMYADLNLRKEALFAVDPVCHSCSEPILSLSDATLYTFADGRDVLLHAMNEACFWKVVNASISRYLDKPRRVTA